MNSKPQALTNIVIREIGDAAEMRAVEQLQKEVWGVPDLDVVPLTQLVAARAAGGVLLGAYDGTAMIGFVYGFAGLEHGKVTHHSHMLAVKPQYRNLSIGYKLKLAQREFVLGQGIDEMTWTFDPLQSLNAYFNFVRLGVISDRYLENFYGTDPASFLHQTGTDRLWVTWQLNSRRVEEHLAGRSIVSSWEGAAAAVAVGEKNRPVVHDVGSAASGTQATIGIPIDIAVIERQDRAAAARWREATRSAFSALVGAGFRVTGFVRGGDRGSYLLERSAAQLELAKFGLVDL